jgi:hypothetical protein
VTFSAGRHQPSRFASPIIPQHARPSRRALFIQENKMTETIKATTAGDAANSEWETQRAAFNRLDTELLLRNKAALFDALAAAGVTHVIVSFDGYGDSGQIENVEAKADDAIVAVPAVEIEIARAEWGQAEPKRSRISLANAIEAVAYDCLEAKHSGWEDNEGAYGEFTFDIAARTVTLDFNCRFIDSEHLQDVF